MPRARQRDRLSNNHEPATMRSLSLVRLQFDRIACTCARPQQRGLILSLVSEAPIDNERDHVWRHALRIRPLDSCNIRRSQSPFSGSPTCGAVPVVAREILPDRGDALPWSHGAQRQAACALPANFGTTPPQAGALRLALSRRGASPSSR